jgi:hypothetical protein
MSALFFNIFEFEKYMSPGRLAKDWRKILECVLKRKKYNLKEYTVTIN